MNYCPHIHELKTLPSFFTLIQRGDKPFELRKNDRDYTAGDLLILREWDQEMGYTGYVVCAVVSCVVRGEWLADGYVALGLRFLSEEKAGER